MRVVDGVGWFKRGLRASNGRIVLLDFEPILGQAKRPNDMRHRQTFAKWQEEQTGDEVPDPSEHPPA